MVVRTLPPMFSRPCGSSLSVATAGTANRGSRPQLWADGRYAAQ